MQMTNINPETGIAYGYISANALDQDVVNELMNNGTNATAAAAFDAWLHEKATQLLASDTDISGINAAMEEAQEYSYEFWDSWDEREPCVEGEHEGVTYASSWLGGALNFFILKSPVVTEHARLASPCVPNAGILDTLDGDVQSYDVPPEWRYTE